MLLPMLAIWALLAVSRDARAKRSRAPSTCCSRSRGRGGGSSWRSSRPSPRHWCSSVMVIAVARARGRTRDARRARAPSRAAVRAQHDAVRARLRRARACRFAVHSGEASGRRHRPASCWRPLVRPHERGPGSARRRVDRAALTALLLRAEQAARRRIRRECRRPRGDGRPRCRAHGDRPGALRPPRHRRTVRAARRRYLPRRQTARGCPCSPGRSNRSSTRSARAVAGARALVGRRPGHVLAAADGAAPTGSAESRRSPRRSGAEQPDVRGAHRSVHPRWRHRGEHAFLNGVFTLLVVVVAAFAVSLAEPLGERRGRGPAGSDAGHAEPEIPRDAHALRGMRPGIDDRDRVHLRRDRARRRRRRVMQLDTARVAAAAFGMVPSASSSCRSGICSPAGFAHAR